MWTYESDGSTVTLLLLHRERKSWNDARQACASAAMRLAQPTFERKNRFIKKVLQQQLLDAGVWFGARRLKHLTSAEWKYTDGHVVKFTDWGKGKGLFMWVQFSQSYPRIHQIVKHSAI